LGGGGGTGGFFKKKGRVSNQVLNFLKNRGKSLTFWRKKKKKKIQKKKKLKKKQHSLQINTRKGC
jgi:hypothetical protein